MKWKGTKRTSQIIFDNVCKWENGEIFREGEAGKELEEGLWINWNNVGKDFLSLKTKLKKEDKGGLEWLKDNVGIYIKDKKRIQSVVNEIAPEHLQIDVKNFKSILTGIKNAGSIFLGKYSPEAMGDYLAGPNHVLPTSGSAKFSSGLSVSDFLKRHSLIKITKRGIERLGSSVINLAQHENLEGHARSIKVRLKKE